VAERPPCLSTGWAQAAANDAASLVIGRRLRGRVAFPPAGRSVRWSARRPAGADRGYGVRAIGGAAVDEHTLFAIASNTKAVTCAALAILIDEGKVKWDEPVRTYLPGFTLSKPELNGMVTVRDLVSHRIGFGLGAGDLLFWPNSDRTRAEIMAAVPHVPIEDTFRTTYHYCNLMFVVAGEVVAAPGAWEISSDADYKPAETETLPLMIGASAKSAPQAGRPPRLSGRDADHRPVDPGGLNGRRRGGRRPSPRRSTGRNGSRCSWRAAPTGQDAAVFGKRANEMWRPNIIIPTQRTTETPGRAIARPMRPAGGIMRERTDARRQGPRLCLGTVLIPGTTGFSYFTNERAS
jgi:hypothetical protein